MGSAPTFIVGLAASVLLVGVASPAAGQTGSRSEPAAFAKTDPRFGAGGGTEPGARPVSKGGQPSSSPAARPSEPTPSASAVAAVAATPAPERAAPPSSVPSGLSHDAPDTAPSIGVVGRGKSKGPSPAATPEPSMLLLMGAGLAGLYGLKRRR
jgi:hypothetical protein